MEENLINQNLEARTFAEKENYCERQFLNNGPFWHLYTDGRSHEIVFANSDDFKYGMNQLALSAIQYDIRIVAFALMNNHFHVIASCPSAFGKLAFARFSHKIGQYLKKHKRPVPQNLFKLEEPIEITDLKMFRSEIAYVIRNGYVANHNFTPSSYPWGSGMLYFQPYPISNPMPFRSIPYKMKRAILLSRIYELPDNILVEDGMIVPTCFCDYKLGESVFRDAHNYFILMSKDLESYSEIAKRLKDSVFYTDEELYSAMYSYSLKHYGIQNPQLVESEKKIEMAKKMHGDYNCSNKQIQRILKLDAKILNTLFPQTDFTIQ